MNDPHVVSLRYSVITPDHVMYVAAAEVKRDLAHFSLVLSAEELECMTKSHFPTPEAARAELEPLLRAWEIDAELRLGRRELRFVYGSAQIVDRNPVPASLPALQVRATGTVTGHSPYVTITRSAYPHPPTNFAYSPDVEAIWLRYQYYLEGKEPLLSMAYFCLTVIEAKAGGRREAADLLQVDHGVLTKLGLITSERGDSGSARKFPKGRSLTPLSLEEELWVNEAVRLLVRRVGEFDGGGNLARITLQDLPSSGETPTGNDAS